MQARSESEANEWVAILKWKLVSHTVVFICQCRHFDGNICLIACTVCLLIFLIPCVYVAMCTSPEN